MEQSTLHSDSPMETIFHAAKRHSHAIGKHKDKMQ
jgi:hypothetical protein